MGAIASQITSLTIVYSTVYSGTDQRKHESSASLALVRGIHRGPGNFPHKWSVTRKMFPFADVIMDGSVLVKSCVITHVDVLNILSLRQNGRHFADDIFICISFSKAVETWIKI